MFTIKFVWECEERGMAHRLYECESFDAYENGEIYARDVYDKGDEICMVLDGNPYQRVYVTDCNGQTVYQDKARTSINY